MTDKKNPDLKGQTPESWRCVDCGVNTHPGSLGRIEMERAFAAQNRAGALLLGKPRVNVRFDDKCEVYHVRDAVWKAAGMEPFGGCLCIGCLEKRLGRELKPKDFANHPFNLTPGTPRLLKRRDG